MPIRHKHFHRRGLGLGLYPERELTRTGPIESSLARTISRIDTKLAAHTGVANRLIKRINYESRAYSNTTDKALSLTLMELRQQLLYTGLNDKLAIHVFALVREFSDRVLGLRHYNSQLLAGWAMYQGQLAEMQTGEGKTLAATLPAAAAALSGVPVHIITTNDYLATRDSVLMRPLYEALGLTVGVVEESMDLDARRDAYACNITYCTNKQICFDYLRDRVERGLSNSKLQPNIERLYNNSVRSKKLMLHGLCFAIVDEADSVLIDEACTPLVLSRNSTHESIDQSSYQIALNLADQLILNADYSVNSVKRHVAITSKGSVHIAVRTENMDSFWRNRRQREELIRQALYARHFYIRDRDYVVYENKVHIVDRNTGRLMRDQSWAHGIQQLIETKEHCELSANNDTLARISYQQFFRRYLKLSGMSGTAREIKSEIRSTYGMEVVCIAPHRLCVRNKMPEHVYSNRELALEAVIASARKEVEKGRAVLIGTRSVEQSEKIARQLVDAGLDSQVLNARHDRDEARVVRQAGLAGRITVATNIAGRGTDIQLEHSVKHNGGLHVIIAERNDAARIDRQLYGRCARQGNPGSYQSLVSLEDEIAVLGLFAWTRQLLILLARDKPGRLSNWVGSQVLAFAQRRIERQHARTRHKVELEDKRLTKILSFAGNSE